MKRFPMLVLGCAVVLAVPARGDGGVSGVDGGGAMASSSSGAGSSSGAASASGSAGVSSSSAAASSSASSGSSSSSGAVSSSSASSASSSGALASSSASPGGTSSSSASGASSSSGGDLDAGVPGPLAVMIGVAGGCPAPCLQTRADVQVAVTVTALASGEGAVGATFLWDVPYAPPGSTATIPDPNGAQAVFVPDVPGSYRLAVAARAASGELAHAAVDLDVVAVGFEPSLAISSSGRSITCQPRCPADSVLIGDEVKADATGSANDPFHGTLVFEWTLVAPPGATAPLVHESNGRVSFRPDVDGDWELRLVARDDVDRAELAASFTIPTALHWRPLDCRASVPPAGTPWAAGIAAAFLVLAVPGRRRR